MDKKAGAELFQLSAEVDYDNTTLQMSFVDLTTGDRRIMGLEGCWRLHQGFFWLKRESNTVREPVATVWSPKTAFRSNDVHTLVIAPNMDVAMIIGVCMVLDERWRYFQSRQD